LSLILVWLPPPLPGLSLYGTLWLILMAYLGRFSALALQPLQAAWRSLDTSLEEAASIDGASLLQTFRHILVPLLAPALTAAVLLVFLQSFAELTLSALLVTSRSETFGWLIFGLQQGGYTQQAAALSTFAADRALCPGRGDPGAAAACQAKLRRGSLQILHGLGPTVVVRRIG
jgi:iron(III) transport system permease protein